VEERVEEGRMRLYVFGSLIDQRNGIVNLVYGSVLANSLDEAIGMSYAEVSKQVEGDSIVAQMQATLVPSDMLFQDERVEDRDGNERE